MQEWGSERRNRYVESLSDGVQACESKSEDGPADISIGVLCLKLFGASLIKRLAGHKTCERKITHLLHIRRQDCVANECVLVYTCPTTVAYV